MTYRFWRAGRGAAAAGVAGAAILCVWVALGFVALGAGLMALAGGCRACAPAAAPGAALAMSLFSLPAWALVAAAASLFARCPACGGRLFPLLVLPKTREDARRLERVIIGNTLAVARARPPVCSDCGARPEPLPKGPA